jgi:hypothetical protein
MFGKSVQLPNIIPPQIKIDQVDALKVVMDGGKKKEKAADNPETPA